MTRIFGKDGKTLPTERRKLVAADLAAIGLPQEFWRAKVDLVAESVRPTIENYVLKFDEMFEKGAGLYLWGDPGRGKTAVAAIVAKEARARGYTVLFTSTFDLREAMRTRQMFDDASSLLDRSRDVDVLVLDHFQATDIAEHYVNLRFVEELLVNRGSKLKVSVLTTTIPREKLVEENETFLKAIEAYVVSLRVQGDDLRKKRGDELKKSVIVQTPSKKS